MKVTNWTKKISAAILAAAFWVPSAHAIDIPLGDPGFEAYQVNPYPGPSPAGYAYANLYGGTSAWIDDLDSPPGYTQGNSISNWLYNTAYGEDGPPFRGTPRNGNQAMHGLFNYSAQETSATFQAGITYTFSIYAQGDNPYNDTNGVFLYIFDGTVPFSDANSLASELFTSVIHQRQPGESAATSKASWTLLSLSHTVAPGAPEIGHPVGVGFFLRADSAVDDASLNMTPEPSTAILVGMGGLSLVGLRRRKS